MDTNPSRDRVGASTIFLIGMRGSGKLTVGRLLAGMLGVPHIDTDDLVTADAACSIREIFAKEGEAGFRRRESQAVRQAIRLAPAIVSLGGGAILDPSNVQLIRASGTVVWITAPVEILADRIRSCASTADARPPLTDLSELDELRKLLTEREELYRSAAHSIVSSENLTAEKVARSILDRCKSNPR